MGRQLTPGFVPFDELAYRDHLKLSIQNYRNVCSAVGPCDGSVAQRTGEAEVKLLAARQFLLANGKIAKDFHFEKGNYEWATAMGDYQKLTREWNEAIGQGSDLNLDKKKLLIEAISKLISLRDGRVNRDKEGDNWVNNLNREMRLLRYDIERNTENKN